MDTSPFSNFIRGNTGDTTSMQPTITATELRNSVLREFLHRRGGSLLLDH